jgi:RNA polymerase sigma-70 factor (ECF subfamily)
MEKHDDFLDLQNCIARLPLKYQEAIALRYFEDKDVREVARILGKSEGTVKSLLHRGTGQLRKMMER